MIRNRQALGYYSIPGKNIDIDYINTSSWIASAFAKNSFDVAIRFQLYNELIYSHNFCQKQKWIFNLIASFQARNYGREKESKP